MGLHVLNVDSYAEFDMPRAARELTEKKDVIGDSSHMGTYMCVLSLTAENGRGKQLMI